VWIGNEVDYSGLRVFGCPTYVHIPSEERSNLIRSLDNVSFSDMGKGLKVTSFRIRANKAVISRNVVFNENSMLKST
jgi:hypothetical protein